MRRAGATVLVTIAALAGCGGGDSEPPTADAYAEFLEAGLQADDPPMPPGPARCVANATVAAVGADRFFAADVEPVDLASMTDLSSLRIDLPDDVAGRLHAGLTDCELATFLAPVLVDSVLAGIGVTLPAEQRSCAAEAVDDNALTLGMAAAIVDDTNAAGMAQTTLSGLAGCPDAMAAAVVGMLEVDAEIGPLEPGERNCITDLVLADAPAAGAALASNDAAAELFGAHLANSCLV